MVAVWTTVARLPCARKSQTSLALDMDDKMSSQLTVHLARLSNYSLGLLEIDRVFALLNACSFFLLESSAALSTGGISSARETRGPVGIAMLCLSSSPAVLHKAVPFVKEHCLGCRLCPEHLLFFANVILYDDLSQCSFIRSPDKKWSVSGNTV